MKAIDASQLTIGPALAKGGQGEVFPIADNGAAFVLKEYFPQVLVDYAVLDEFTEEFAELPERLRSRLAYPMNVITRGGRSPSGFLMPRIPKRFFLPNGREKKLEHLLNGPTVAQQLGFTYTQADVYRLLIDLADTLEGLHRNDIAYGDISPKNVLVSFEPEPIGFFIDCDSMAIGGRQALAPVATPDWDAPRPPHSPVVTTEADAYKFGLLVLRLLAGDQQVRTLADLPADVPHELRGLLERALSNDPSARGPVGDWIPPLTSAAAGAGDFLATGKAPSTPSVVPATPVRHYQNVTRSPAAAAAAAPAPRLAPVAAQQATASSRGGTIAGTVAVIVVLILIVAGIYQGTSSSASSSPKTRATTTSAQPATPYTATRPTPTTSAAPTLARPTTPAAAAPKIQPRPATSWPADLLTCPGQTTRWSYSPDADTTEFVPMKVGVGDTTPTTHCNFAASVADAFGGGGQISGVTRSVISPNTGQSYPITCLDQSGQSILARCTDGKNAVIYFYY